MTRLSNRTVIIAAAVCCLALAGAIAAVLLASGGGPSPEQVATEYHRAWLVQDHERVCELTDPGERDGGIEACIEVETEKRTDDPVDPAKIAQVRVLRTDESADGEAVRVLVGAQGTSGRWVGKAVFLHRAEDSWRVYETSADAEVRQAVRRLTRQFTPVEEVS